MQRYLLYFLLFCGFIFSVSCNKDKLKAPKSGFLVIEDVGLNTVYSTQGTNSHKITDIWYYVNDEFKGAFPVGSVMPIVASGETKITLYAGIKNNGISDTRLPYAAYDSKIYNLTVEPGKTYTLSPKFEYNSSTYFYYKDDFDSAVGQGQYFGSDGNNNCRLTTPSEANLAFGGTGQSYYMTMTEAQPVATLLQTSGVYLPPGGSTIYVELNYKCNQPVTVGIIGGTSDKRGAITLNRTYGEWNKIYVQLTSIVSTQPVYGSYKVYIEASRIIDNPEIYIDNVKLIYQ
ncbi:MAG: hypothetical protein V4580_10815 [Bacteroidota bacterium]